MRPAQGLARSAGQRRGRGHRLSAGVLQRVRPGLPPHGYPGVAAIGRLGSGWAVPPPRTRLPAPLRHAAPWGHRARGPDNRGSGQLPGPGLPDPPAVGLRVYPRSRADPAFVRLSFPACSRQGPTYLHIRAPGPVGHPGRCADSTPAGRHPPGPPRPLATGLPAAASRRAGLVPGPGLTGWGHDGTGDRGPGADRGRENRPLAAAGRAALDGEIVNADSMQLYRGMDIGTAKLAGAERERRAAPPAGCLAGPGSRQRRRIPAAGPRRHRRVPAAAGCRSWSAAPACTSGPRSTSWNFPAPTRCLRRRLEAELAEPWCGPPCTPGWPRRRPEQRPRRSCPATAAGSSGRWRSIGCPGGRSAPRCPGTSRSTRLCRSACGCPGPNLTERIADRVDRMWQAGFVAEVRALAGRGLREGRTASRALGYAQVLRFLAGEWARRSRPAADTVLATRRFARRQETWFRRDPRISWLAAGPGAPRAGLALAPAHTIGACGSPRDMAPGTTSSCCPTRAGGFGLTAGAGGPDVRPAGRAGRGRGAARGAAARTSGRRTAVTRPNGSWTIATPTAASPRCAATASGCSPGTCWSTGWPAAGGQRGHRGGIAAGAGRGGRLDHRRDGPGAVLGPGRAVIGGLARDGLRVRWGIRTWPAWSRARPGLVRPVRAARPRPGGVPGRRERGGGPGDRGPGAVTMRVHERGSGETRSCGTGAVAAAAAAAAAPGPRTRRKVRPGAGRRGAAGLAGPRARRGTHRHPGGRRHLAHRPRGDRGRG